MFRRYKCGNVDLKGKSLEMTGIYIDMRNILFLSVRYLESEVNICFYFFIFSFTKKFMF